MPVQASIGNNVDIEFDDTGLTGRVYAQKLSQK